MLASTIAPVMAIALTDTVGVKKGTMELIVATSRVLVTTAIMMRKMFRCANIVAPLVTLILMWISTSNDLTFTSCGVMRLYMGNHTEFVMVLAHVSVHLRFWEKIAP